VWRIVINASHDAARVVDVATGELEQRPALSESPLPGDEFGVRRWVATLPERQRLAVFLRYYGDCDYRTIARALEVEVGTVSATLSAARTALRRMLKEVPS
jgi:DNA-directed RNA polymerase specialized sigma24 family protein